MTGVILHAGCGGENLPPWLADWGIVGKEVKLDINPGFNTDIVASIDDLGDIGPYDAVFSCHCVEHLHWYRAMKALHEFYRVLKPGGIAVVEVPNLSLVKPDDTVAYVTDGGLEITGLDMYYGHRGLAYGDPWMMHGCGFVPHTMTGALEYAGFKAATFETGHDLIGVGVKPA